MANKVPILMERVFFKIAQTILLSAFYLGLESLPASHDKLSKWKKCGPPPKKNVLQAQQTNNQNFEKENVITVHYLAKLF